MGRQITCQAQDIQFPQRCVACGRATSTTCTLRAKKGLDLGFLSFSTSYELPVPACGHCKTRRIVVGIILFAVWIAAVAGLMFSLGGSAEARRAGDATSVWIAVICWIALLWILLMKFGGWIDTLTLRTRFKRWDSHEGTVTLWLANEKLADEIVALSANPLPALGDGLDIYAATHAVGEAPPARMAIAGPPSDLYFAPWSTVMVGLATVVSCYFGIPWLIAMFRKGPMADPPDGQVLLLVFMWMFVGSFWFVASLARIRVTEDTIEKSLLGMFRKVLERDTSRLLKAGTMDYVIVDDAGDKIRVHHWMRGSAELFHYLAARQRGTEAQFQPPAARSPPGTAPPPPSRSSKRPPLLLPPEEPPPRPPRPNRSE